MLAVRTLATLFLAILLFSTAPFDLPVHALNPRVSYADPNRTLVAFRANASVNAQKIASKYHVPIVNEDDSLSVAVFLPSNINEFLASVKTESSVWYAEPDIQACILTTSGCGGGGGGGGGSPPPPPSPDFAIAANPSHLAVFPGKTVSSAITLSSLNGFYGTVNLFAMDPTAHLYPSVPPKVYLNYTGNSATKTVSMQISTSTSDPLGSYSVALTGNFSSGSIVISHTLNMIIDLTTDFSIGAAPSNIAIPDGQTGASTISIMSPGFSGTVYLSATVSPNGPSVSMIPASVQISSGGTTTSTLSIVTNSLPLADYVVTVTGNNLAATHNSLVKASIIINDPLSSTQWALSDLNIPQAWRTTTGSRSVIVADLDTGAMLDHPDLQGNLWTNPTDGSHGWNYFTGDNNPYDDNGHGTLVAGIIAGVVNNGLGVAGSANELVMPIKVCDSGGSCPNLYIAQGLQWAWQHGARIISMPFGDFSPEDPVVSKTILNLYVNDSVLFVASSGDSGNNGVFCPACLDHVIAVGAIQNDHALWTFNSTLGSTYGSKIELVAPGVNVLSTNWPGSNAKIYNNCSGDRLYCSVTGTSFSAPYVAGVAALILDYYESLPAPSGQSKWHLTNQQLRDALDYYTRSLGPASGAGPNPQSDNPNWNDHLGYGEPDASRLMSNMGTSHALTLSAQWQYFTSSGTEGQARVWVANPNPLLNGVQVGNGVTVNAMIGDDLSITYQNCFNDGAHNVFVHQISGGGELSGVTTNSASIPTFIMGAVPSSTTGVYYVGNC